jgi:antitoxin StbD
LKRPVNDAIISAVNDAEKIMTNIILSDLVSSISELKKHPMQVVDQACGRPVAILNRNKPVFYCVSPAMFESLMERIEDEELIKIINSRIGEPEIKVDINDL